jgi:hypothetical protein
MIAARLKKIVFGSTVILLVSSPAWSIPNGRTSPNHGPSGNSGQGRHDDGPRMKAPEIDASSGATAMALLAGVILLVREKSARRDS